MRTRRGGWEGRLPPSSSSSSSSSLFSLLRFLLLSFSSFSLLSLSSVSVLDDAYVSLGLVLALLGTFKHLVCLFEGSAGGTRGAEIGERKHEKKRSKEKTPLSLFNSCSRFFDSLCLPRLVAPFSTHRPSLSDP